MSVFQGVPQLIIRVPVERVQIKAEAASEEDRVLQAKRDQRRRGERTTMLLT